jgi:hypothetical protein
LLCDATAKATKTNKGKRKPARKIAGRVETTRPAGQKAMNESTARTAAVIVLFSVANAGVFVLP